MSLGRLVTSINNHIERIEKEQPVGVSGLSGVSAHKLSQNPTQDELEGVLNRMRRAKHAGQPRNQTQHEAVECIIDEAAVALQDYYGRHVDLSTVTFTYVESLAKDN